MIKKNDELEKLVNYSDDIITEYKGQEYIILISAIKDKVVISETYGVNEGIFDSYEDMISNYRMKDGSLMADIVDMIEIISSAGL